MNHNGTKSTKRRQEWNVEDAEDTNGSSVFGPIGAAGCSHGWSGGRCQATAAQPVEGNSPAHSCPGGAAESLHTPPAFVYPSPMRPHPRIRKTIKWGGLLFALAIVTLVILSGRNAWRVAWAGGSHVHAVSIEEAQFRYTRRPWSDAPLFDGQWTQRLSLGLEEWRMGWWFRHRLYRNDSLVWIPLWFPLLLAALPAALAWRLDTLATRRAKLGACPTCSYPRTGLAPSASCPECGAAAPQA